MTFATERIARMLWFALFAAFIIAAFAIRDAVAILGISEIWGWDYRTFVGQIQDWRWIGYFGFRHPGLGLVCSPLVTLEHIYANAYLLVMPAVATVTAWMIFRMSGILGLVLWLSFPTTWLMAGIPESFPIAQFGLVAAAFMLIDENHKEPRYGCRAYTSICLLFATLNGMITITNGIKPMLMGLSVRRRMLSRRALWQIAIAVVATITLGAFAFYVRSLITGRGVADGLRMTFTWIPAERHIARELYEFFIQPVGLLQSFVVYPLVFRGLMRRARSHEGATILPLAACFAVDTVIHLIVGWGMSEPWVFAPHWLWILPLLANRKASS